MKHLCTAAAGAMALLVSALVLSGPAAATSSFDCARATTPDEYAICDTQSLALLDDQVAAGYAQVVSDRGRPFIRAYGADLLHSRRSCGSDVICIEMVQRYSIEAYAALTSKGNGLPGASFQGLAMRHLLGAWDRADQDCRGGSDPATNEASCFLRDDVLRLMLLDLDLCPGVYDLDFAEYGAASLLRSRWLPCFYSDITQSGAE